jgi:hypothetical protein
LTCDPWFVVAAYLAGAVTALAGLLLGSSLARARQRRRDRDDQLSQEALRRIGGGGWDQ